MSSLTPSLPQHPRASVSEVALRVGEVFPRSAIRLVSPAGLAARGITFSRSHLWRLEHQGSFPRRVHVGKGRVAWVEHEIDEYLEGLAAARVGTPSMPANEPERAQHAAVSNPAEPEGRS